MVQTYLHILSEFKRNYIHLSKKSAFVFGVYTTWNKSSVFLFFFFFKIIMSYLNSLYTNPIQIDTSVSISFIDVFGDKRVYYVWLFIKLDCSKSGHFWSILCNLKPSTLISLPSLISQRRVFVFSTHTSLMRQTFISLQKWWQLITFIS